VAEAAAAKSWTIPSAAEPPDTLAGVEGEAIVAGADSRVDDQKQRKFNMEPPKHTP
jgi:hypothetical protein